MFDYLLAINPQDAGNSEKSSSNAKMSSTKLDDEEEGKELRLEK
jgi:hypothetical protein